MKKILVLGAGLVSRPLVRYLLNQNGFRVTVASRTVSKAENLVGNHERGCALPLDVTDQAALEKLVAHAAAEGLSGAEMRRILEKLLKKGARR